MGRTCVLQKWHPAFHLWANTLKNARVTSTRSNPTADISTARDITKSSGASRVREPCPCVLPMITKSEKKSVSLGNRCTSPPGNQPANQIQQTGGLPHLALCSCRGFILSMTVMLCCAMCNSQTSPPSHEIVAYASRSLGRMRRAAAPPRVLFFCGDLLERREGPTTVAKSLCFIFIFWKSREPFDLVILSATTPFYLLIRSQLAVFVHLFPLATSTTP